VKHSYAIHRSGWLTYGIAPATTGDGKSWQPLASPGGGKASLDNPSLGDSDGYATPRDADPRGARPRTGDGMAT